MVVSHRYDFQRPSIKRTEEGIATMSGNMVSVDEESLKSDLRELVRKTVQETLNALLDEEADEMVGAERYERTAGREAYRSGHYRRKLVTTSGEVVLDVPKLRGATFQTAVIERYRRRETSVEETIIEMYLGAFPCAASRTSPRSCGARASRPEPCRTSTRRRSKAWMPGGPGRFPAATRTCSSTAYT